MDPSSFLPGSSGRFNVAGPVLGPSSTLKVCMQSQVPSTSLKKPKDFQLLRGIKELVEIRHYKVWLLDQFGVLHDGQKPYPGAIDTLNQISKLDTKMVIISNSSRRASSTLQRMQELGFDPSIFAGIITSGELTHEYLLRRHDPWFASLGRRCIHMTWSERSSISLEGLGLEVVEEPELADFILAHGTEALGLKDGNVTPATLEELEGVLRAAVRRGIPMVVANPDHVTVEARDLMIMPGTLGLKYENLGGHVQYMGKPDAVIYQAVAKLTAVEPRDMIAVGDSLFHDIQGAMKSGIDSMFVAGGIHAQELGIRDNGCKPTAEELNVLFDRQQLFPSYVVPMFHW